MAWDNFAKNNLATYISSYQINSFFINMYPEQQTYFILKIVILGLSVASAKLKIIFLQ
jgi:hypothetical protein